MKSFTPFLLISLMLITSCSLLSSDENLPDIPGKIVFSAKDDDGISQIYTMKANGSDVKQLTDLGPEDDATHPSWSPDGQQIIFSSTQRGTTAGPALWVMDANGANQRVLYDPEPDNPDSFALAGSNARWSPDGSKVAFDFCRNCSFGTNHEIYVFDTLTKELTRLTDHPASDRNPTWSPDGSQIAFSSNRDYIEADTERFRNDLYAKDINGIGLQRLTNSGDVDIPNWGSETNKNFIAYAWQHQDPEIFLFNRITEETKKITNLKFVGKPLWNKYSSTLLIPGTKNDDKFVFQYINISGKIIEEVSINIEGLGQLDWLTK